MAGAGIILDTLKALRDWARAPFGRQTPVYNTATGKWDPQTPPRVFHVDDYGAVGDGTIDGTVSTFTDDTAAFQAATDAAVAAGGGRVRWRNAIYRTTAPITTPAFPFGRGDGIAITFEGDSAPVAGYKLLGFGEAPGSKAVGPTIINTVSTILQPLGSVEFLGFSNVHVTVQNSIFRKEDNPAHDCLDLSACNKVSIDRVVVDTNARGDNQTFPSHGTIAVVGPLTNSDWYKIGQLWVVAYDTATTVTEHLHADHLFALKCNKVLRCDLGAHDNHITRLMVTQCTCTFYAAGPCVVNVDDYDFEFNTTTNWARAADVFDPNGYLSGVIRYHSNQTNVGPVDSFVIVGNSPVKVVRHVTNAQSTSSSNTDLTAITLADVPFCLRNLSNTAGNFSIVPFLDYAGEGCGLVACVYGAGHAGTLVFLTRQADGGDGTLAEKLRITPEGDVVMGLGLSRDATHGFFHTTSTVGPPSATPAVYPVRTPGPHYDEQNGYVWFFDRVKRWGYAPLTFITYNYDTFQGTAGTSAAARDPDLGPRPTVVAGTWVLDGTGRLHQTATNIGLSELVYETSHADMVFRVGVVNPGPNGFSVVLHYRYADDNNTWTVILEDDGSGPYCQVGKRVGGTGSFVAGPTTIGTPALWSVEAHAAGNVHTVKVNGVTIWTGTDADNNTNTKVVLRDNTVGAGPGFLGQRFQTLSVAQF